MAELFESIRNLAQDVVRNIVSLRESEDPFDDLSEGDDQLSRVATAAEMRVKQDIAPGIISRGFHYATAIGYPFSTDHFMATRYGDGSYPAWYGSLDIMTTINETAFHMARREFDVEGIDEPIIQERLVYDVYCQAVLIDLTKKEDEFPGLTANDYSFTQAIGKRLYKEGHPGLLAPSARHSEGQNAVVFTESTLSNPRPHGYLTYNLDPLDWSVTVEQESGKVLTTIFAGRWL